MTIDERLFDAFYAHDEVISPIVINDNLLAVRTTATSAGQPAELEVIPDTAAFEVVNRAETVGSDGDTQVSIVPAETTPQGDPLGRRLIVDGTIAEGSDLLLNVFPVPDPATFARTLFIEALERAGVSVGADPMADNDAADLPDDYPDGSQVASLRSPTVEATATLIWKISHNYGANLSLCLLAVTSSPRCCRSSASTGPWGSPSRTPRPPARCRASQAPGPALTWSSGPWPPPTSRWPG